MNILVSNFSDPFWMLPPSEVERLRHEFPLHAFLHVENRPALLDVLPRADAAFTSILDEQDLAHGIHLRWIHSPAAGVGRLLTPALRARETVLTNSRGIHGASIAEHVIGVVVMLARRLHHAAIWQHQRRWQKVEIGGVRLLRDRRLGLIGLGAIGTAVAAAASALGMRVSAVRRRPQAPAPAGVDVVYPPSDLPELLRTADVVVLAAPLTAETRGLIGARELAMMKRDAVLVNVARGKLVREPDLAAALTAGTIGGAALDVFEHEPLDPASPLWGLPNVIITAHTAGYFAEYWTVAVDLFAENLRRHDRGEPLLNVVDKHAGY
jgi:phosphoglycerate dehydrogenase-like enzyme